MHAHVQTHELALLSHKSPAQVSDEELVGSFVDSVSEGGCVRRYIEVAQLAQIIDGTVI